MLHEFKLKHDASKIDIASSFEDIVLKFELIQQKSYLLCLSLRASMLQKYFLPENKLRNI